MNGPEDNLQVNMDAPEFVDRELDSFEQDLRRAMRRVDAPASIKEKFMLHAVAAKATQDRLGVVGAWKAGSRVIVLPRRHAWAGSLAASVLFAGIVFGGVEHHRAATRAEAERDFALSQQIENQAMAHTREQLQRAGVRLDLQ